MPCDCFGYVWSRLCCVIISTSPFHATNTEPSAEFGKSFFLRPMTDGFENIFNTLTHLYAVSNQNRRYKYWRVAVFSSTFECTMLTL